MEKTISYENFQKVEIRAGKVLEVSEFPEARNPAYKLKIDFGPEVGIKRSSAQITFAHTKEDLIGKMVLCVVNFEPKQIGPFVSEVLTLGLKHAKGGYMAINFNDDNVELGDRLQ